MFWVRMPTAPTGVKRHLSVSHSEVCVQLREGSDLLGTKLLEQGLEVRLRGLQSLMVSHDPANSQGLPRLEFLLPPVTWH